MNIFLTHVIFFFLIHSLIAGAWTQKKGGYFFKLSAFYLKTDYEFNHLGDRLKILEERLVFDDVYFRDVSFGIYTEYGFSDFFTVIGYLPYKSYTSKRTVNTVYQSTPEQASTSGFADLTLSGRLAVLEKPFALSLQGGVKIPTGYSTQPENNGPRLGTGNPDYEGMILAGVSLYPVPLYFTGGAGYRHRTGKLNDEWLFHGEMGFTTGNFLLKTYIEWIKNTTEPPDIYGQPVVTPLAGGGGIFPEVIIGDQDILKVSPSVIYFFNGRMGLQGEITYIIAGKNTLSGITYSISLILTYL